MDAEFLHNLIQKIEIDISADSESSIASLSACLGLSKAHPQRLFKFAFDLPLATYIRSRRLAYAAEQILNSDSSILLIALRCQFEHEQSFSRAFKNEFGLTPGDYRKNPVPLKSFLR
ncbi:helix-turn-helix transcriptional regulator [Gorillibacterium sp. CAU 1737]|uniref:helix-turn-helix transcriptional regulator n=1 Tax=Gorillibacterium sp. CAU 1737 TaxID=3140362 RepID=UPI0032610D40